VTSRSQTRDKQQQQPPPQQQQQQQQTTSLVGYPWFVTLFANRCLNLEVVVEDN